MDNELLNQILTALIPVLITLITTWFGVLGNKIKTIYQEKVNTEIKKKVVQLVVESVQQMYKDLDGADRLNKAIHDAQIILNEKGIMVSETELRMLIEAAVYGMKKGFYEEQQKIEAKKEEKEA